MKKIIIYSPNAPSPIGPYNQGILMNDTLYISGQISLNPKTKKMVKGDLKKETIQIMENLNEILKSAEMNFDNIVKSTIFLTDIDNFNQVNEIYGSYFDKKNAPARETVAVKSLPKKARVEISLIAMK